MTQNDYIAEYIKEKHPSLLGTDFAIWKLGRVCVETTQNIIDTLKLIDWSKIDLVSGVYGNCTPANEGGNEDVVASE